MCDGCGSGGSVCECGKVRADLTTLRQQFFSPTKSKNDESPFFLMAIFYIENKPNYGQIRNSHAL